jgi:NTE family protein
MRALVLSGGGSKSAWQAGALKYLLGELEISYSILCGVSAGALNCAFLSMFKDGEEVECAEKLCDLWLNIETSSIYKRWFPFGFLHALWQKSFYDNSPMHSLIRDGVSLPKIRESGKIVTVGAVSLTSGKYTTFDHTSDYFVDAVIASASFPGMFKPIEFLGQLWNDGGTKQFSPIQNAIDMGATEIDIIMTSPETRINHFMNNPSVADILNRSFDLSTDKIMSNDIEKLVMYNKLAKAGLTDKKMIKYRIIRPKHNLIEDLLDFSPNKIKEMMEKGYNEAVLNYEI